MQKLRLRDIIVDYDDNVHDLVTSLAGTIKNYKIELFEKQQSKLNIILSLFNKIICNTICI